MPPATSRPTGVCSYSDRSPGYGSSSGRLEQERRQLVKERATSIAGLRRDTGSRWQDALFSLFSLSAESLEPTLVTFNAAAGVCRPEAFHEAPTGGGGGGRDSDFWSYPPAPVEVVPDVSSEEPGVERAAAFMKTKMCKFYLLGQCTRGPSCQFAHNKFDLQPLPDLFRTKLCQELLAKGHCDDQYCRFAHNKEELRNAPPVERQAYPQGSWDPLSNGIGQQNVKKQQKPQKPNSWMMQKPQKPNSWMQQSQFQQQACLQFNPQLQFGWEAFTAFYPQHMQMTAVDHLPAGMSVQAAAFSVGQAAQAHEEEAQAVMLQAEVAQLQDTSSAESLSRGIVGSPSLCSPATLQEDSVPPYVVQVAERISSYADSMSPSPQDGQVVQEAAVALLLACLVLASVCIACRFPRSLVCFVD
ncbi:unnamed protein product [Polarella glacialis]|uniref:C3H1-type domain-containing protein n=1 Tax=Polarella glacialis TaxID=89957 RepID=A0A813HSR3_POLGL|nr:unnamed protein product [Polarella glacialis]